MTTLKLKQTLLQSDGARQWTDEQLRQFNVKVLDYIQTSNGKATVPSKAVKAVIGDIIPTKADRHAAAVIRATYGTKNNAHSRPEDFLNKVGGEFFYTPSKVRYVSLMGDVQERNNSVLPTRFDDEEHRSNVQAVACLVGQIVQNKGSEWVPNINAITWGKIFRGSTVSHADFLPIADDVCAVLNEDHVWEGMQQISRSAVTGVEALMFIRAALDRCAIEYYHLINTRIVLNLFKVFERSGESWFLRENDQGKPLFPSSMWKQIDEVDPSSAQLLAEAGFPTAFWYLSGYVPPVSLPPNLGTMAATRERYARSADIAGAANSASNILGGMRGYSGLTDDMGKRVQFLLSSTLSVWALGRMADVQLSTVGDLPMLISSTRKWNRYITEDLKGVWGQSSEQTRDVKFLVPSMRDAPNVHAAIQTEVIYEARHDSVVISWEGGVLPTPDQKNGTIDYEAKACGLMPIPWRHHDTILYSIVYGKAPFQGRAKKTQDVLTASTGVKIMWNRPTFVYAFGTSAHWRGIISTLPNLRVTGYGARNAGTPEIPKWDEGIKALQEYPLHEIQTPEDWYKRIGQECGSQAFSFLAPKSRYNPISNLPYITKAGVQIVLQQHEQENGELIGNVVHVARVKKTGTVKLVVSKPHNDVASIKYQSPVTTTTTTNLTLSSQVSLRSPPPQPQEPVVRAGRRLLRQPTPPPSDDDDASQNDGSGADESGSDDDEEAALRAQLAAKKKARREQSSNSSSKDGPEEITLEQM